MPRRKPDLKKRLDEVREEPETPVHITLELDPNLLRNLKRLARRKRIPVEAYIGKVLAQHVEDSARQL